MTIQLPYRKVYLQLLFLFAFLLISVILIASGSVKSFAESNPTRWITVDESELTHIQDIIQNKGESFDLKMVEKNGGLSVVESDESQILDLTRSMHTEFHKCAGFMSHETLEAARLSIEETQRAELNQPVAEYTINNQNNVNSMLAEAKESQVLETITRLSTDFPNRRYNQPSGLDSANWIRNKWTQLAAGRSDITVEFFNHPAATSPQPSIILTVQGTTLPNEVVVLGGHQDSINHSGAGPTGNAPGADDDASGIASLTEAIRVMVAKNFRPERTVKFMAYAAEEVGLRGSNAIAADFQARAVNVVGVLQLDMTNYKSAGSTVDIAVITDFTNAAQNQFLRDLIVAYQPSLVFANATCGYSCSDHASWTNKGFPASFPFEPRSNPTIHTTSDTLAQSGNNASHAIKYSKIAISYIGELAKGTLGSSYESDVAPRPNGDGIVDATDTQFIERFSVGLDKPYISNEAQRADSAPKASGGDGVVDALDVQQAELYSVGIGGNPPATGPLPMMPTSALNSESKTQRGVMQSPAAPRTLTVESTSGSVGNTVTVDISVEAFGDEFGYSFSIDYDSTKLRLTGVATGGIPNETIVTNIETTNPNPDPLGLSVRFGGGAIPANGGVKQVLVRLTFQIIAGAGTDATVNFTSSPSNQATTSQGGTPLPTSYINGVVRILLRPTAATTSISGRVKDVSGAGIGGVSVAILNASSGETQTTLTDAEGVYRFEDLAVGVDYIITPRLARHSFTPSSKSVSLVEELTETDFTAVSKYRRKLR